MTTGTLACPFLVKMKNRLCFNSIFILAIFLLSGCISFKNPIINYSDAVIDESLLGLWKESTDSNEYEDYILILKDDNNPKYKFIIFNNKDYKYDENDYISKSNLIYSGILENKKYIVLNYEKDNSYFFLEYEISNDTLRFFTMDTSLFENAINKKKIKGNIIGNGINKEIFINENTDSLQDFIKKNENIFDENEYIEYKRQIK